MMESINKLSGKSHHRVPPGFRFHPTDEELVNFYLKNKVSRENSSSSSSSNNVNLYFHLDHVIPEIDLNKLEPWDLSEKCNVDAKTSSQYNMIQAPEWYFFSHKDKKYPTGTRTNRATVAGFWKATGRDKAVVNNSTPINIADNASLVTPRPTNVIGMRKTLVFYRGRAPHGKKTDWIMHEYRLEHKDPCSNDNVDEPINKSSCNEGGWVVCRVFKKRNLHVSSKGPTCHDDDDEDNNIMRSPGTNLNNVNIDTNPLPVDVDETALSSGTPKVHGSTNRHRRPIRGRKQELASDEPDVDNAYFTSATNFSFNHIKSETNTLSDGNTLSTTTYSDHSLGPSDHRLALDHINCTTTINEDYNTNPSAACAVTSELEWPRNSSMFDECVQLPSLICSKEDNEEEEDHFDHESGNNNNNNKRHHNEFFMMPHNYNHDNLAPDLIYNGQVLSILDQEYDPRTTWNLYSDDTSIVDSRLNVDLNPRPTEISSLLPNIDNIFTHHPPALLTNPSLVNDDIVSLSKNILIQNHPYDHDLILDQYNMNPSYTTSCDLVDLWNFTR